MKNLNDCKEIKRGKTFSKSEQGKTFVLCSDNEFDCHIVDIDHCVFETSDAIRRCDLLFLVPVNKKENLHMKNENSKAFYVELKGGDVKSGCEQLFKAIDRTKSQISNFDFNAMVVGTAGWQPEILNNEYYRKVKRLIKKDIQFRKVHKANKFTHTEII
jgi:hypothetical protein